MVMRNLTLLSLFLHFYKIMCFKKSTPNAILYSEFGRHPADILIKSRMIGFWKILVCGKRDKMSCILYHLMYKMHTRNFYFSKWLNCVQNTLNSCRFSEYWIHQNVPDNCGLAKKLKNALLISLNRPGINLYLNFLSVLILEFLSKIMVLQSI